MPSGSNQSLKINSVPYDVAGDADFSEVFSKFLNELVPHSGGASIKQTRRIQETTGVVLIGKPGDKSILKGDAESGVSIPMSYKNANGDKYTGNGTFNIENNTTMDNRISIALLPTGDWTESLA